MNKWSDFETYLKPEHLGGKRPIVTIAEIAFEETHPNGKAETAAVAYFVGAKRGLILTPTNRRTLQKLFGDEIQACRGGRVQLEVVHVQAFGRDSTPIRIVAAPPKPAAPTAPAAEQPSGAAGDQPTS
jgi:hypothetical protein